MELIGEIRSQGRRPVGFLERPENYHIIHWNIAGEYITNKIPG